MKLVKHSLPPVRNFNKFLLKATDRKLLSVGSFLLHKARLCLLFQVPSPLHTHHPTNKKEPQSLETLSEFGVYLLSHQKAVPSALWGLTSLFGMVRGGSPTL